MKDKRKMLRTGISALVAFALFLVCVAVSALTLVKSTLLNEKYLKKQLVSSGYAAHVVDEVTEEFVSYGMASGFDEVFFSTILEQSQVQADVDNWADLLYGTTAENTSSSFTEALYQKLLANCAERGYEVNTETDEALRYLAETCYSTYKTNVYLSGSDRVTPFLQQADHYLTPVLWVCVALLPLLLVFLMSLHPHRREQLPWLMGSFGGCALLMGIPAVVLRLSGIVTRVALSSRSLNTAFVTYGNHVLDRLMLYALLWLVLWGVLLAVYCRTGAKKDDEKTI